MTTPKAPENCRFQKILLFVLISRKPRTPATISKTAAATTSLNMIQSRFEGRQLLSKASNFSHLRFELLLLDSRLKFRRSFLLLASVLPILVVFTKGLGLSVAECVRFECFLAAECTTVCMFNESGLRHRIVRQRYTAGGCRK